MMKEMNVIETKVMFDLMEDGIPFEINENGNLVCDGDYLGFEIQFDRNGCHHTGKWVFKEIGYPFEGDFNWFPIYEEPEE